MHESMMLKDVQSAYTRILEEKSKDKAFAKETQDFLKLLRQGVERLRYELQEDEIWKERVLKNLEDDKKNLKKTTDPIYMGFFTQAIQWGHEELEQVNRSIEAHKHNIEVTLHAINELANLHFLIKNALQELEHVERQVDQLFLSISPKKKDLN